MAIPGWGSLSAKLRIWCGLLPPAIVDARAHRRSLRPLRRQSVEARIAALQAELIQIDAESAADPGP
jgi:hypothetical protein